MTCIPCNRCGSCSPCSCYPTNPCYTVVTSGCPVQLDFACIIYHKTNSEISELDGLNLSNGSTLELVIETIDEKVKQLNVLDFVLPILRATYVVNTMQQFCTSVDTQLGILNVWRGNVTADPSSPVDGWYWYNTTSTELKIRLNGATKIVTIT